MGPSSGTGTIMSGPHERTPTPTPVGCPSSGGGTRETAKGAGFPTLSESADFSRCGLVRLQRAPDAGPPAPIHRPG
jgi:hypothetical protein